MRGSMASPTTALGLARGARPPRCPAFLRDSLWEGSQGAQEKAAVAQVVLFISFLPNRAWVPFRD